jgi:hypothetical protein
MGIERKRSTTPRSRSSRPTAVWVARKSGQADQSPNGRGVVHDVKAEDLGAPCVRCQERREHSNERRLAGSVRPEQSEDKPLGHVEIDTCERNRRAKVLGHTLDVNGGSGRAGRNHARATILRRGYAPARCHISR